MSQDQHCSKVYPEIRAGIQYRQHVCALDFFSHCVKAPLAPTFHTFGLPSAEAMAERKKQAKAETTPAKRRKVREVEQDLGDGVGGTPDSGLAASSGGAQLVQCAACRIASDEEARHRDDRGPIKPRMFVDSSPGNV
jgi:hypothetical protein